MSYTCPEYILTNGIGTTLLYSVEKLKNKNYWNNEKWKEHNRRSIKQTVENKRNKAMKTMNFQHKRIQGGSACLICL